MPVKKGGKDGGYTWGKAGTKSKLTKAEAEAVGRAAYANGYRGESEKRKGKSGK
jgi:hypothetical protein